MIIHMAMIGQRESVQPGLANPGVMPNLGGHSSNSRRSHELGFGAGLYAFIRMVVLDMLICMAFKIGQRTGVHTGLANPCAMPSLGAHGSN